jgi:two-component system, OmpR family, sensor kinase
VLNKQRQFIADAAHELRTPLTAVSLQAQIAERATDPEKHSLAFSDLRLGIARASHVVQQLLMMARFDPETFQPVSTPLRLDELIRTLLPDFMPLATEPKLNLSLVVGEMTLILGDADTLRILFGSVLNNAIRYTPAGGRIEVSVLAKGDMAYLEVNDNGIGIPYEERTRVFDRFYRVLGNSESGSGLGLAIVKRIADQHHATIILSDGKSGKGLNVNICFPVLP